MAGRVQLVHVMTDEIRPPKAGVVLRGICCGGNVCCPGFEDTCGKSFPCPVAHPGFHGQCEIPERIDLKEASVITFDNVEHKNLAATTGDAGMLVKNASSHLGVFRDLLICAVDDDGPVPQIKCCAC